MGVEDKYIHPDGSVKVRKITSIENHDKEVWLLSEVEGECCFINIVSPESAKGYSVGGYIGYVEKIETKKVFISHEDFKKNYEPFPASECVVFG